MFVERIAFLLPGRLRAKAGGVAWEATAARNGGIFALVRRSQWKPCMIDTEDRMQGGDVVGERFVVEALAGTGGMGAVYRARDRSSDAVVALKVVADAAERHALRARGARARGARSSGDRALRRARAHGARGGRASRWSGSKARTSRDASLADGSRSETRGCSRGAWPRRSRAPTRAASCIATSSRATSSCRAATCRKLKVLDFGIARHGWRARSTRP